MKKRARIRIDLDGYSHGVITTFCTPDTISKVPDASPLIIPVNVMLDQHGETISSREEGPVPGGYHLVNLQNEDSEGSEGNQGLWEYFLSGLVAEMIRRLNKTNPGGVESCELQIEMPDRSSRKMKRNISEACRKIATTKKDAPESRGKITRYCVRRAGDLHRTIIGVLILWCLVATITAGSLLGIGMPHSPQSTPLLFTHIPIEGETDPYVSGRVAEDVDPEAFLVVLYIKVSNRWWGPKPAYESPYSVIKSDRTFKTRYLTGGLDDLATHFQAYLIPIGSIPFRSEGLAELPAEMRKYPWVMSERPNDPFSSFFGIRGVYGFGDGETASPEDETPLNP
ncbi:MAG TPA: hypothetical protein VN372_09425 [Methanospirillum sp.]|nr:hypothetical protein [Methanospirillum sp.]